MLVEFECPECKGHMYEKWSLDGSNLRIRLMYWHMILNPGLAINELVLGQRTPKALYACLSCDTPLVDRSYLHCPGCDSFHQGRIWAYRNAFGNWLGLVCPACGESIPCLWNLASRLILALTAPIWWIPVTRYRSQWLQASRKRIADNSSLHIESSTNSPKPVRYFLMGNIWALFMSFFTGIIVALLALVAWSVPVPSLIATFIATSVASLIVWIPAGWLFGLTLKWIVDRKGSPALHIAFDKEGKLLDSESRRKTQ
ncbi:MAG: hypothetical protein IPM23_05285 [Candidatus Melainabacteria bacterium]|nr:hypothetical protein [Candidatus Melainabacteria bacterium]